MKGPEQRDFSFSNLIGHLNFFLDLKRQKLLHQILTISVFQNLGE